MYLFLFLPSVAHSVVDEMHVPPQILTWVECIQKEEEDGYFRQKVHHEQRHGDKNKSKQYISLGVQALVAAHRPNCVPWKGVWTYPVDSSGTSKSWHWQSLDRDMTLGMWPQFPPKSILNVLRYLRMRRCYVKTGIIGHLLLNFKELESWCYRKCPPKT